MSLTEELKKRILILDGAMGTMIQRYALGEEDYRTGIFAQCPKDLKGNNECLNITHPEIIRSIHEEYIAAGADIIETNSFSANEISQAEYGCADHAALMAFEAARIAREAADAASRKVFVAGSMGPTSKSLSLSSDMSDPTFRTYSFDDMYNAYRNQAEALLKGGVDLLLIETCFDALNVKAALYAVSSLNKERKMTNDIPVIISVSVGDRSGRTLTGQTIEAFYAAVCHYPVTAFGLNCSLGAKELMPLAEDMDRWCGCATICYPNAGLPNEMGGYDQSPAEMSRFIRDMAEKGLLNITGGCCGTTPDHIRAIAGSLKDMPPRKKADSKARHLTVSGLEAVEIDVKNMNFINVGERTNVAGSRKFSRLIASGNYDEALEIAAAQIADGAVIIDINMDDAMLDSTREMERFLRCISNEPSVAKAALMIDSSHWETILSGLKNACGKCIVNSISLKEGEQSFIEKARTIKELGAAMVVMAFDEEGQAVTYKRKIEICSRAYRLLTEKAGVPPHDIIFDANILSIGTGIEEHAEYAVDFIEAVRWIKGNLPGALTSGGVSNLSFAFRGNNAVREAMHSAFLYHAINAGLDMAIVNPSMLQVYDEIEPELLECVEDVIFNRNPGATERLIDKASRMLCGKEGADRSRHAESEDCPLKDRLKNALIKGSTQTLEDDLHEALVKYGNPVDIIEQVLMSGMETIGRMFSEGKMFLPQVVKSAKVMRDAVGILDPYIRNAISGKDDIPVKKPRIVLATVKGDVHDIGKNITGIVLSCNGFEVHDLGVMVDRKTILDEAEHINADMIAVSGLITPSLYQMEEICREMSSRGMSIPLFVGGATTSALHTAVKLAPVYDHVYHGADASACAVMAKKYTMDSEAFETGEKAAQQRLRELYSKNISTAAESRINTGRHEARFPLESYITYRPEDIPTIEIPLSEVLPYFDWKMFYAIWGVRYGAQVPEVAELIQLRNDAEEEIDTGNFRIRLSVRFFDAQSENDDILIQENGRVPAQTIPMFRQENAKALSLSDFVIPKTSGRTSVAGAFAISVDTFGAHVEGCCCPACSDRYEELVGRTVRMTLAEAASCMLDKLLASDFGKHGSIPEIIKPAAGYASCPDHTLKRDILSLLPDSERLGIKLTESCAMIPEASICGFIFMHPQAEYPDIRKISKEQYDGYMKRRKIDEETARLFLSHLLK